MIDDKQQIICLENSVYVSIVHGKEVLLKIEDYFNELYQYKTVSTMEIVDWLDLLRTSAHLTYEVHLRIPDEIKFMEL